MTTPLIFAALWVVAATLVALLPMRWQFLPGILLLVAASVLLYLLAKQYGLIVFALAFAAFLSMFRRPLIYLSRRVLGRHSETQE